MNTRIAQEQDIPAIALLMGQLGYSSDETYAREQFSLIIADPSHVIFVAEDPEKNVVGLIHLLQKNLLISIPALEIGELIVDGDSRRKGIGKMLIAKAEAWARENGHKGIMVGSSKKRVESHLFYKNAGYSYLKEQVIYFKEV